MQNLNERSWEILQAILPMAADLHCRVIHPPCGSIVVDAGVQTPGSLEAGLRMAELSTAGLASVRIKPGCLRGKPIQLVEISTSQPYTACYLCQSANWSLKAPLNGMGSGPACLLGVPDVFPVPARTGEGSCAVLVLESARLPGDEECRRLAQTCGVPPQRLGVMVAPTASPTSSVQIAARSVETALHKLGHLHADLEMFASAVGLCPVAPVANSDLEAMGLCNDAVTFGASVWLQASMPDDALLATLTEQAPSSTSPDYGQPFLEVLKKAGNFYNIDAGIFAPAELTITNTTTGQVHHAGAVDELRLLKTLGIQA